MRTKEERLQYGRDYKVAHKEEIRRASREYAQKRRLELGKEEVSLKNRYWADLRKRRVLTHYGKGKLACVGCGFDDIRALSIDHIDGGGNQDRKRKAKGGANFYCWLSKKKYPKGYQTLCMNCQWVKRFENKEHQQPMSSKQE
ncbi:MAG: hypothetical protein CMI54_02750 [Parcubacteria group bacterium]|jgi:hypothetical protein|nr:hypothetical protein [Parcubacteria group bacterium]|tara:strand:- start:33403 stop:33831 length:429 start_codon:yes stop_codon:yes gene_type:complete